MFFGVAVPAIVIGFTAWFYLPDSLNEAKWLEVAEVMEVLTFAGLPTMLFLQTPTGEQLARFADCRCIGTAGIARLRSPDWMNSHLPPVFRMLAGLKAPIVHYRVCSTIDSAPHVGSIGRAIEIDIAETSAQSWPAFRR